MITGICAYCDGTGERDFLSGARCYHCDGKGYVEESDDDFEDDDFDNDLSEEWGRRGDGR